MHHAEEDRRNHHGHPYDRHGLNDLAERQMRHPPQSKTVSNMVDFVQSNAFALISEAVGAHAITSACFMRRWASLVAMRRTILDRPADRS